MRRGRNVHLQIENLALIAVVSNIVQKCQNLRSNISGGEK